MYRDTLLWADSLYNICAKQGIILNPEKFVFDQVAIEFAGSEITQDSVCPCTNYLRMILNFPTPKNITDIRSYFDIVNQMSYAFSMADKMQLNALFIESKSFIMEEIEESVRIFNRSKPTCLAIGNRLFKDGKWVLVTAKTL